MIDNWGSDEDHETSEWHAVRRGALDAYRDDLKSGDVGVLCAFGAGYTVGSQVLRKL